MKIIGIDFDGVVADFISGFRAWVIRQTGRAIVEFPDPQTWEFYSEWGLSRDEWEKLLRTFMYSEEFKYLTPLPGVLEGLGELRRMGHHIAIITARGCDERSTRKAQAVTCEWLARHNTPYDSLIFTGEKGMVALDILLDDRPENLNDAGAHLAIPVCMDMLYNRGWEGHRVSSFAEFVRLVAIGKFDPWEWEPLA